MESIKPNSKILILGPSFSTNQGEGITLTNFFYNWPEDHLAVATEKRDLSNQSGVCKNYYHIGSEEKRWVFPFRFLQNKTPSGKVPVEMIGAPTANGTPKASNATKSGGLKRKVRYAFAKLLSFMGIYHRVFRYEVSKNMLQWIREFQPDIIYTHATNIGNMKLALQAAELTNARLAVHIMDDYLNVMNSPGLTYRYWKNQTNKQFRKLLDRSDILMSICQEMSDEYKKRYGRDFVPFHNPVVLTHWFEHTRNSWDKNGKFTVMYAGRIGRGTSDSLVDIAKAVAQLGEEGLDIRFNVQSTTRQSPHKDMIEQLEHCHILPPVAYEELPRRLSSADLLVLPMDFDPENFNYIRLSMPTKCSEYMATGVPVMVYAPAEAALSQYANRKGWAAVVTDESKLKETIRKIYEDCRSRKMIAEQAKMIAENEHDAKSVRNAFRQLLESY